LKKIIHILLVLLIISSYSLSAFGTPAKPFGPWTADGSLEDQYYITLQIYIIGAGSGDFQYQWSIHPTSIGTSGGGCPQGLSDVTAAAGIAAGIAAFSNPVTAGVAAVVLSVAGFAELLDGGTPPPVFGIDSTPVEQWQTMSVTPGQMIPQGYVMFGGAQTTLHIAFSCLYLGYPGFAIIAPAIQHLNGSWGVTPTGWAPPWSSATYQKLQELFPNDNGEKPSDATFIWKHPFVRLGLVNNSDPNDKIFVDGGWGNQGDTVPFGQDQYTLTIFVFPFHDYVKPFVWTQSPAKGIQTTVSGTSQFAEWITPGENQADAGNLIQYNIDGIPPVPGTNMFPNMTQNFYVDDKTGAFILTCAPGQNADMAAQFFSYAGFNGSVTANSTDALHIMSSDAKWTGEAYDIPQTLAFTSKVKVTLPNNKVIEFAIGYGGDNNNADVTNTNLSASNRWYIGGENIYNRLQIPNINMDNGLPNNGRVIGTYGSSMKLSKDDIIIVLTPQGISYYPMTKALLNLQQEGGYVTLNKQSAIFAKKAGSYMDFLQDKIKDLQSELNDDNSALSILDVNMSKVQEKIDKHNSEYNDKVNLTETLLAQPIQVKVELLPLKGADGKIKLQAMPLNSLIIKQLQEGQKESKDFNFTDFIMANYTFDTTKGKAYLVDPIFGSADVQSFELDSKDEDISSHSVNTNWIENISVATEPIKPMIADLITLNQDIWHVANQLDGFSDDGTMGIANPSDYSGPGNEDLLTENGLKKVFFPLPNGMIPLQIYSANTTYNLLFREGKSFIKTSIDGLVKKRTISIPHEEVIGSRCTFIFDDNAGRGEFPRDLAICSNAVWSPKDTISELQYHLLDLNSLPREFVNGQEYSIEVEPEWTFLGDWADQNSITKTPIFSNKVIPNTYIAFNYEYKDKKGSFLVKFDKRDKDVLFIKNTYNIPEWIDILLTGTAYKEYKLLLMINDPDNSKQFIKNTTVNIHVNETGEMFRGAL